MPERRSYTFNWLVEKSAQVSATEKCLNFFTVYEIIGIYPIDFKASQIASHSRSSVECPVHSSINM